jgi:hypothetical protein
MQFALEPQPPLWQRLSQALHRRLHPQAADAPQSSDTISNWPPAPGKVLSGGERLVHAALEGALRAFHPQGYLFAHVPLPRLVRVPSRRSYKDWLARTGHLSADFVLCDAGSRTLAVVMMAAYQESPRGQRRRERLLRVLQAAEVRVIEWPMGWQPTRKELGEALFGASAAAPAQTPAH